MLGHTWCNCPKNFFGIELLLFEKNEMEQKLNFNHNALTIEQLLQSRSNCSIVRAIGQFVHTAHWQVIVERYLKEKNLPRLNKTKFLVPTELALRQFQLILRYCVTEPS